MLSLDFSSVKFFETDVEVRVQWTESTRPPREIGTGYLPAHGFLYEALANIEGVEHVHLCRYHADLTIAGHMWSAADFMASATQSTRPLTRLTPVDLHFTAPCFR